MKKEKKNKIKLTTLILFILVGIFILLIILPSFNKNSNNSIVIQNQTSEPILENEITNQVEPIVIENMEDSFSFEFLKMENNKTNMIYSPLSIKYALSMLSEGANGNTKTQINNVIRRLNLTKYENIDKILSLANGVYIRNAYKQDIKDSFKNTLADRFDAEVKYDAFKNAKNVNSWIEDKTFGILKDIVADGTVQNPDCVMLLINALAIDMEWANEFNDDDTWGESFYLENGEEIVATTMNKETSTDDISYYKDNNITALTMDLKEYEDTQLEFMAIMPENNLDEYVKTITVKEVNDITNKLVKASDTKNGLDISIPKFEFDYNLKLKEDLQKLGIQDAFNEKIADFSNISEREMYVSEAIHKADIKFSEEGIRAAAVTVFAMWAETAILKEQQPIEIDIDKPFLFLIRDKETEEIWFVGTVYEPNLWEEDKDEYQEESWWY